MQKFYDSFYSLVYELGAIYTFVMILIGFVSGILVWRWYRGPEPGAQTESPNADELNFENELEALIAAVSELWEQTESPSIKRPHDEGKKVVVKGVDNSLWRRWYRRLFGSPENPEEQRAEMVEVGKSRAADAAERIRSQTVKIRHVVRNYPFTSQPPVTNLKPRHALRPTGQLERKGEGQDRAEESDSDYLLLQRQLEDSAETHQHRTPSTKAALSDGGAGEAPAVMSSGLVPLYNNAVCDSFAREQFREEYQPIRIGTVNAVERRQNPTALARPEFRETSDGDFFALRLSEPTKYAVVPRLGLTIGAVSYNAGALGEMFGNPPYDPAQSYSRYRLIAPAHFKREGEQWILERAGALDLGPGD